MDVRLFVLGTFGRLGTACVWGMVASADARIAMADKVGRLMGYARLEPAAVWGLDNGCTWNLVPPLKLRRRADGRWGTVPQYGNNQQRSVLKMKFTSRRKAGRRPKAERPKAERPKSAASRRGGREAQANLQD